MNEITGMISFIIMAIVPTTVVAVIIYIIVVAVKNKDTKNGKLLFPKKFFFQIYLYLISLLTIILAISGGVSAIRGAASYKLGIPFSYTLYRANSFEEMKVYDTTLSEDTFVACSDGEVIDIEGKEYCFNYSNQSTDLIMGAIVFVLMLVIFGIHQFALRQIKEKVTWLRKLYIFISLVLYSAASLISIPISIYQLSNFLMTDTSSYSYSTPTAPAMALAVVLFVLPIWIYFLVKVSKSKNMD